jgi:histidinol-phosphate/aromatic aminotransferase/cobyric acid decarboxylase-like protein
LRAGRVVLLSNPHNPSGRAFDAERLLDLADDAPQGVLVVDESYVEFAPDPVRASVLGRAEAAGRNGPSNLIVLRSPSKFFGVAGARVAVAWSPAERLREALRTQRGSWPVSAIEVAPVAAALADRSWTLATHAALCADARWLEEQLDQPDRPLPGAQLVRGSVTHFRLVHVDDATAAAESLAAVGLGVRPLGPGHGLPGPALRIAAPRIEEREACAAMLAEASVGGS